MKESDTLYSVLNVIESKNPLAILISVQSGQKNSVALKAILTRWDVSDLHAYLKKA